jgi:hypothetical protein
MAHYSTHVCFCGYRPPQHTVQGTDGIRLTNQAVMRHAFGRDVCISTKPMDGTQRRVWTMKFGPAKAAGCPHLRFLALPPWAFTKELQNGKGRAASVLATPADAAPPSRAGETVYSSVCVLCETPFCLSVRAHDRSSMPKKQRVTRPVCRACAMWTSPRCNNAYAMCHVSKRTRRCTTASLPTYDAKMNSPCLVIDTAKLVHEYAAIKASTILQCHRRRKRRPPKHCGNPADQKLAQFLLDALTTTMWSEVVGIQTGDGTVHRRPRADGPGRECTFVAAADKKGET